MHTFTYLFRIGIYGLVFMSSLKSVYASSTIFDGIIVKVHVHEKKNNRFNKDGTRERYFTKHTRITMKALNSPYSSVGLHASMQTLADGTVRKLETRGLDEFDTFYIDDIPVTQEQIKPLIVEGARISIFENRSSFYFLRVVTRAHDHKIGYLTKLEGNKLEMSRPQMGYSKALFRKPAVDSTSGGKPHPSITEANLVNLHYSQYPWLVSPVELDSDAVVKTQGETVPWKEANLEQWVKTVAYPDVSDLQERFNASNNEDEMREASVELQRRMRALLQGRVSVLVQNERKQDRIEILPPGFGDWKVLVNELKARPLGGPHQLAGQFMGIMLPGNPVQREVDTRGLGPHVQESRIRKTRAFHSYLVAGGPEKPGPLWRGIYSKGEHWMVDGFFADRDQVRWHQVYTPGLFFVAHIRRSRSTPDMIATDSELVKAWGIIRSIEGGTVQLEAPEIEHVPVAGKQTYTIPKGAEYYHLGQKLSDEQVKKMFVKGALIRVYPARPQTILLNEKPGAAE